VSVPTVGRKRHRTASRANAGSALVQKALHFGDLGLLAVDDLLGQRLGVGVGALAQLGLGHADGAMVVLGHHPQPHRVERATFGGTAGMSVCDTADGCFMNLAYGWAFAKPVRKIFCNITITALSVAVARQRADGWGLRADRAWPCRSALRPDLGTGDHGVGGTDRVIGSTDASRSVRAVLLAVDLPPTAVTSSCRTRPRRWPASPRASCPRSHLRGQQPAEVPKTGYGEA
jgi:hypothetical protein